MESQILQKRYVKYVNQKPSRQQKSDSDSDSKDGQKKKPIQESILTQRPGKGKSGDHALVTIQYRHQENINAPVQIFKQGHMVEVSPGFRNIGDRIRFEISLTNARPSQFFHRNTILTENKEPTIVRFCDMAIWKDGTQSTETYYLMTPIVTIFRFPLDHSYIQIRENDQ